MRRAPYALWLALAMSVVGCVVGIAFRLHTSIEDPHPDFEAGTGALGLACSLLALTALFELAASRTGAAAVGARIAAIALAVHAVQQASFVFFVLFSGDYTGTYRLFGELLQWTGALASVVAAVGVGLAAARALGAVLAGGFALVLSWMPLLDRLLWGWVHRAGFDVSMAVGEARWWLTGIAILVLALVASSRAQSAPEAPRVGRGLRSAALALRIFVGCKGGFAVLGAWMIARGDEPAKVAGALAMLALACQVAAFVIFAFGLLGAARGRLADLSGWALAVGAALALWVAGVGLHQLQSLYLTLFHRMDLALPLPAIGDLATAAAVVCLLTALRAFTQRRDLTHLAGRTTRQLTVFALLSVGAIAGTYWVLHHVGESAHGGILLAVAVSIAQLVALVYVARVVDDTAFVVERDVGSGLPTAKLVSPGAPR